VITCIKIDLSTFADLAQVVIAIANILLAVYIFTYQRSKDQLSEKNNAILNEQNIKLQWFKELIIQPNIAFINSFYEELHTLQQKIVSDTLTEEEILALNRFINDCASNLRKSFLDSILNIDKNLYKKAKENIDNLVTELTMSISNDEYKLTNNKTYEKVISSKIYYSKNNLLALIFNYKGI